MSSVLPVYNRWVADGHDHTPQTPLTSGDAAPSAVADAVPSISVKLTTDYTCLWWVSRFKQLRTDQLATLAFPTAKSRTSWDRVLKKLVKNNQLERLETGVTNTNVYQLGVTGWPVFHDGRRKVRTTVDDHALAIADVYIAVLQASRNGAFKIIEEHTEPDTKQVIANTEVRPDLYLVLEDDPELKPLHLWVEVDLGGERQRQLTEKIERYIWAHNGTPEIPQIVFLCPNEQRVREIYGIITKTNAPDGLMRVGLLSDTSVLWQ